MMRYLSFFILTMCAVASDWYVTTDGVYANSGDPTHPIPLVKALSTNSPALPGDTIWVSGGTYADKTNASGYSYAYISKIKGSATDQVTVRARPGQRVIIDSYTNSYGINILGSNVTMWGFEITSTDTNRCYAKNAAVFVQENNVKLINMIMYDNGGGVVSGADGLNTEVSGCIIYNNGYQDTDRGHGHGLYMQGENPNYKLLRGNVLFNHFGLGGKAYSETPNISGFKFIENISFNNGCISTNGFNMYDLQIGGLAMTHDVHVISNYTYKSGGITKVNSDTFTMFYGKETNGNLVVSNNYVAGGTANIKYWSNGVVIGNTFILGGSYQICNGLSGDEPYIMDWNTYYFPVGRPNPFWFNFPNTPNWSSNFVYWTNTTGYDVNSTSTDALPTTTNIFLVKDLYEANRGFIAIYNWKKSNVINVNISSLVSTGSPYRVVFVHDIWGNPVASSNSFGGELISCPMTNQPVALPFPGDWPPAPFQSPTNGPEFACLYVYSPWSTNLARTITANTSFIKTVTNWH